MLKKLLLAVMVTATMLGGVAWGGTLVDVDGGTVSQTTNPGTPYVSAGVITVNPTQVTWDSISGATVPATSTGGITLVNDVIFTGADDDGGLNNVTITAGIFNDLQPALGLDMANKTVEITGGANSVIVAGYGYFNATAFSGTINGSGNYIVHAADASTSVGGIVFADATGAAAQNMMGVINVNDITVDTGSMVGTGIGAAGILAAEIGDRGASANAIYVSGDITVSGDAQAAQTANVVGINATTVRGNITVDGIIDVSSADVTGAVNKSGSATGVSITSLVANRSINVADITAAAGLSDDKNSSATAFFANGDINGTVDGDTFTATSESNYTVGGDTPGAAARAVQVKGGLAGTIDLAKASGETLLLGDASGVNIEGGLTSASAILNVVDVIAKSGTDETNGGAGDAEGITLGLGARDGRRSDSMGSITTSTITASAGLGDASGLWGGNIKGITSLGEVAATSVTFGDASGINITSIDAGANIFSATEVIASADEGDAVGAFIAGNVNSEVNMGPISATVATLGDADGIVIGGDITKAASASGKVAFGTITAATAEGDASGFVSNNIGSGVDLVVGNINSTTEVGNARGFDANMLLANAKVTGSKVVVVAEEGGDAFGVSVNGSTAGSSMTYTGVDVSSAEASAYGAFLGAHNGIFTVADANNPDGSIIKVSGNQAFVYGVGAVAMGANANITTDAIEVSNVGGNAGDDAAGVSLMTGGGVGLNLLADQLVTKNDITVSAAGAGAADGIIVGNLSNYDVSNNIVATSDTGTANGINLLNAAPGVSSTINILKNVEIAGVNTADTGIDITSATNANADIVNFDLGDGNVYDQVLTTNNIENLSFLSGYNRLNNGSRFVGLQDTVVDSGVTTILENVDLGDAVNTVRSGGTLGAAGNLGVNIGADGELITEDGATLLIDSTVPGGTVGSHFTADPGAEFDIDDNTRLWAAPTISTLDENAFGPDFTDRMARGMGYDDAADPDFVTWLNNQEINTILRYGTFTPNEDGGIDYLGTPIAREDALAKYAETIANWGAGDFAPLLTEDKITNILNAAEIATNPVEYQTLVNAGGNDLRMTDLLFDLSGERPYFETGTRANELYAGLRYVNGQDLANSLEAVQDTVKSFTRAVGSRAYNLGLLSKTQYDECGNPIGDCNPFRTRIWAGYTGYWGKADARGGDRGYDYDAHGFNVGVDHLTASGVAVGAAFGYSKGDYKLKGGLNDDSNIKNYSFALYGSFNHASGWFTNIIGSYTRSDYDMNSQFSLGGAALNAGGVRRWNNGANWDHASYDSNTWSIGGSTGFDIAAACNFTITPSIGLFYYGTDTDTFDTFVNGAAMRHGMNYDRSSLEMPIDVTMKYDIPFGCDGANKVSLIANGGYSYNFINKGTKINRFTMTDLVDVDDNPIYSEGDSWGRKQGSSTWYAGAGLQVSINRFDIGAYYEYVGRKDYNSHNLNVTAGVKF